MCRVQNPWKCDPVESLGAAIPVAVTACANSFKCSSSEKKPIEAVASGGWRSGDERRKLLADVRKEVFGAKRTSRQSGGSRNSRGSDKKGSWNPVSRSGVDKKIEVLGAEDWSQLPGSGAFPQLHGPRMLGVQLILANLAANLRMKARMSNCAHGM